MRAALVAVAVALGVTACGGAPPKPARQPPLLSASAKADAKTEKEEADDARDGRATLEPLEPLLRADPAFARFLEQATERRVQILLTPVAPPDTHAGPAGEDGERKVTSRAGVGGARSPRRFGYRVDEEYFYPASAAKLPVAIAALEALTALREERGEARLGVDTPLRVSRPGKRPLLTTIREQVQRALVVSDNHAHNRLLDFAGAEELAGCMARYGWSSRVVQRLGLSDVDEPSTFELLPAGAEAIAIPRGARGARGAEAQPNAPSPLPSRTAGRLPRSAVGRRHIDKGGKRVDAPMDFADKNEIPLGDLQDQLLRVVRPDLATGPQLRLGQDERSALADALAASPSELMRGPRSIDDLFRPFARRMRDALPGRRVRVLAKGGRAYGFVTVNAYVELEDTKRAAFVAATIFASDTGTINDDNYAYETVADPFLVAIAGLVSRVLRDDHVDGATAALP